MVKQYPARAVRLYLLAPHYRSAIEFSDTSLAEATAQLARIDAFLERAGGSVSEPGGSPGHRRRRSPTAFTAAMDDDLGTPAAIAVLFETVKDGNKAADAGDTAAVASAYASVRSMLGVLGLDPGAPEWADAGSDDLRPVVDGLVAALLDQRQQARARKDWPAADAIRDRLAELGLKIEDTPNGPRWSLEN